MSFGFSVGDFVSLIQLARSTYKNCVEAGAEYTQIAREIKSLNSVLKPLRNEAQNPDSPLFRQDQGSAEELLTTINGCRHILEDLQTLLAKYEGLSTNGEAAGIAKKLWHQFRFSTKIDQLGTVRGKLIAYTSTISVMLDGIQLRATGRVEEKIDNMSSQMSGGFENLRKEICRMAIRSRAEQLGGSTMSLLSLSTYAGDDKEVWREFRRGLMAKGYRSKDLDRHKDSLQAYMLKLDQSGILDEAQRDSGQYAVRDLWKKQAFVETVTSLHSMEPVDEEDFNMRPNQINVRDSSKSPRPSGGINDTSEAHTTSSQSPVPLEQKVIDEYYINRNIRGDSREVEPPIESREKETETDLETTHHKQSRKSDEMLIESKQKAIRDREHSREFGTSRPQQTHNHRPQNPLPEEFTSRSRGELDNSSESVNLPKSLELGREGFRLGHLSRPNTQSLPSKETSDISRPHRLDEPFASNTSASFQYNLGGISNRRKSEVPKIPQSETPPPGSARNFKENVETQLSSGTSTPYIIQGGEKTDPYKRTNVNAPRRTAERVGKTNLAGSRPPRPSRPFEAARPTALHSLPHRQYREKAGTLLVPRLSTPYATQGGEKTDPFETARLTAFHSVPLRNHREEAKTHSVPRLSRLYATKGGEKTDPFEGSDFNRPRHVAGLAEKSNSARAEPPQTSGSSERHLSSSSKHTDSSTNQTSQTNESSRAYPHSLRKSASNTYVSSDSDGPGPKEHPLPFVTRPRVFAKMRAPGKRPMTKASQTPSERVESSAGGNLDVKRGDSTKDVPPIFSCNTTEDTIKYSIPPIYTFTKGVEKVNTAFNVEEWGGKLKDSGYLAASGIIVEGRSSTKARNRSRRILPIRRKQMYRSQGSEWPPRPKNDPGIAQQTTESEHSGLSPAGAKFSAEDWVAKFTPQSFEPPGHRLPSTTASKKPLRKARRTAGTAAILDDSSESASETGN